MQAFNRTQKEIDGVVFVGGDTIFTTRNITLMAEVGAHIRIFNNILVVLVF